MKWRGFQPRLPNYKKGGEECKVKPNDVHNLENSPVEAVRFVSSIDVSYAYIFSVIFINLIEILASNRYKRVFYAVDFYILCTPRT
jgi:hypothetical protein